MPTNLQMPRTCINRMTRWALMLFAAATGVAALAPDAAAQAPHPMILRWDVEATVVQIDDLDEVFPEVRLGDPVHGWLSFHLEVIPNADSWSASYTHPAMFPVTRMIIGNPRTGGEIVFEASKDASAYHNVDVFNDRDDDVDVTDYFIALDDVLPPPGMEAQLPVTAIEFTGPPDVLHDLSLPQQLDLADWPQAILSYHDLLAGVALYAEIYSLTPVEVAFAASDFDFDGDVDAEDMQVWTLHFGTDGYMDADSDFDYDADGADLLVWQRQLGSARPGFRAYSPVPEPMTWFPFIMATAGVRCIHGRQRQERVSGDTDQQPTVWTRLGG